MGHIYFFGSNMCLLFSSITDVGHVVRRGIKALWCCHSNTNVFRQEIARQWDVLWVILLSYLPLVFTRKHVNWYEEAFSESADGVWHSLQLLFNTLVAKGDGHFWMLFINHCNKCNNHKVGCGFDSILQMQRVIVSYCLLYCLFSSFCVKLFEIM